MSVAASTASPTNEMIKKNTLSLGKNNPAGLIAALSNNNMFWRTSAQRLLVEKGDNSVLPALYKLVQDEDLDEIGINAPAVHALWILHGLKALSGNNPQALAVATKALIHPAGGVRKAVIEVLPKTTATLLLCKRRLFSTIKTCVLDWQLYWLPPI